MLRVTWLSWYWHEIWSTQILDNKKQKCVRVLDKKLLFSISYEYFSQQNVFEIFIYFFCNETKTKAFLENRAHTFLSIKKNFTKRNFRQTLFDLEQLELLEVLSALQNCARFGSILHDKYSIAFF